MLWGSDEDPYVDTDLTMLLVDNDVPGDDAWEGVERPPVWSCDPIHGCTLYKPLRRMRSLLGILEGLGPASCGMNYHSLAHTPDYRLPR